MKTCCERAENSEILREYDPQPRNKDGSIRWFLFRWDDGKQGSRRLVRCRVCGALYLVQGYRLNRFSAQRERWFEDWYRVKDTLQADGWNARYTGMQLEHAQKPAFRKTLDAQTEKV